MTSPVKERPILFSGAMVRALLNGSKTQTRRVVMLPHNNPLGQWEPTVIGGEHGGRTKDGHTVPLQGAIWHTRTGDSLICPHGQPGDGLYVRETAKCGYRSEQPPSNKGRIGVDFRAGGGLDREYTCDRRDDYPWFPSKSHNADGAIHWAPAIHMPRWASRITLEITGVRVDRLQNISYDDALAEGMSDYAASLPNDAHPSGETPEQCALRLEWPQRQYRGLWDELNAARGYGWDINPWVWVVEFKRIKP
jgi:hypothetical protein